MSLRMIPNLDVYRPADAVETAACWELALQKQDGPGLLALTLQNLPQLRLEKSENLFARGPYRLRAATASRNFFLLPRASEVEPHVGFAVALDAQGIGPELVS